MSIVNEIEPLRFRLSAANVPHRLFAGVHGLVRGQIIDHHVVVGVQNSSALGIPWDASLEGEFAALRDLLWPPDLLAIVREREEAVAQEEVERLRGQEPA